MGDARSMPLDRKYIPHAIAWVNAWNETVSNKFIPDFMPNKERIDSAVKEALTEKNLYLAFKNPKEVLLFSVDEPFTRWLPLEDINDCTTRWGITIPVLDPLNSGYQIFSSRPFFERAFYNNSEAEILRLPYLSLVSEIYDEIKKQRKTLFV